MTDSEDPTKKRTDVVIDNFEGSCSLGIDVTVVDPRNLHRNGTACECE